MRKANVSREIAEKALTENNFVIETTIQKLKASKE